MNKKITITLDDDDFATLKEYVHEANRQNRVEAATSTRTPVLLPKP